MFRVPHPDLISAFLPPPMPRHLTSMPGHRAPDTGHAMVVASGAGSSPASGGWESRFSHTKPRSTRRKKPTARIFVPSWLRVSLIESANPVQLVSRHFRISGPQTPDTGPARVVASGAAGGGSGEPGVPQGINKIRIYHSTHLPLRLCGFARVIRIFSRKGAKTQSFSESKDPISRQDGILALTLSPTFNFQFSSAFLCLFL